jgi:hypothetical protein
MEEQDSKEEKEYCFENIKAIVEKELKQYSSTELNEEDLDIMYKLVDIIKDLKNIDYWKIKEEVMKMRYENYGDYSEGRYSEGRYGRRGVPGTGRGRYRGHDDGEDMIEDMRDSYSAYSESRSAYNRGNYNAGQDSMEALEDTMRLFTEFAQKMIQEVDSPEAKQIIKKHLRKISQMG